MVANGCCYHGPKESAATILEPCRKCQPWRPSFYILVILHHCFKLGLSTHHLACLRKRQASLMAVSSCVQFHPALYHPCLQHILTPFCIQGAAQPAAGQSYAAAAAVGGRAAGQAMPPAARGRGRGGQRGRGRGGPRGRGGHGRH